MEKMMEMMIKAMGLDTEQVKSNITNAAIIFKQMSEQLNRVEQKLDLLLKDRNDNIEKVLLAPLGNYDKSN